jgi:hypothetical protein
MPSHRGKGTGAETTTFEAFVNAPDGRPFVQMTCALDGAPVFAVKMSPAVCTALGLRAIQASIEAERDAGLIEFLRTAGFDDRAVAVVLVGLREHREQFDAASGTMRPLSGDDPSELTDA